MKVDSQSRVNLCGFCGQYAKQLTTDGGRRSPVATDARAKALAGAVHVDEPKHVEEARKTLAGAQAAVDSNPMDVGAMRDAARMLAKCGRFELAAEVQERLLRVAPGLQTGEGYSELAKYLNQDARPAQANHLLKNAKRVLPDRESQFYMAAQHTMSLLLLARFDDALDALKPLEVNDFNADFVQVASAIALYRRGQCSEEQGAQADRIFNEMVNPILKAEALIGMGRLPEASHCLAGVLTSHRWNMLEIIKLEKLLRSPIVAQSPVTEDIRMQLIELRKVYRERFWANIHVWGTDVSFALPALPADARPLSAWEVR